MIAACSALSANACFCFRLLSLLISFFDTSDATAGGGAIACLVGPACYEDKSNCHWLFVTWCLTLLLNKLSSVLFTLVVSPFKSAFVRDFESSMLALATMIGSGSMQQAGKRKSCKASIQNLSELNLENAVAAFNYSLGP